MGAPCRLKFHMFQLPDAGFRKSILDDIHFREKQLSYLDYLRYSIRKKQDINNMI